MAPGLVDAREARRGASARRTPGGTRSSRRTAPSGPATRRRSPRGSCGGWSAASSRPGGWCLDFFAGLGDARRGRARARAALRPRRREPGRDRGRPAAIARRTRQRILRNGVVSSLTPAAFRGRASSLGGASMSATATAAPEGTRPRRRLVAQLWFWVLVAIAAGIVFGLVAPDEAKKAKWLADAFIQLIKTVTGPVIFVTVVIGIASLGNLARAGGLALRALAYFFCATVVALTLGLLAANIVSRARASTARSRRPAARRRRSRSPRPGPGLGHRRVHHRPPAADELPAALRRQRDPPGPRPRDPHGGRDLDAPARPARADRRRLRGRLARDLRDHPADHVGRPDRRVRRHGLHRRAVRQRRR